MKIMVMTMMMMMVLLLISKGCKDYVFVKRLAVQKLVQHAYEMKDIDGGAQVGGLIGSGGSLAVVGGLNFVGLHVWLILWVVCQQLSTWQLRQKSEEHRWQVSSRVF